MGAIGTAARRISGADGSRNVMRGHLSANDIFPAIGRWFGSTPHRTFIVYPVAVVLSELAVRDGQLKIHLWAAPFLLWGYLQYRLVGRYRRSLGGGGPGTD